MSKSYSVQTLGYSEYSLHVRLHKHLDEYEQEFQVRNVCFTTELSDAVTTLRALIDQTIGEACLLARFTKAVNAYRTWQDVFSYFYQNDLTIAYYMGLVLKQISKDAMIMDLEKQNSLIVERYNQTTQDYEAKLAQLQVMHKQQLDQVDKSYQDQLSLQSSNLQSAEKEVQVLRKQLQVLQSRIMQSDDNKIAELTQQNMRQLQVISDLQKIILRHRTQHSMAVEETKHSIDYNADIGGKKGGYPLLPE